MIVIPPVRVIAERRVVEHLRRYGAVTPDKPMGYAPIRWSHASALARLRAADVVKSGDGGLWLCESAWDLRRGQRRKRVLTLLALGAVSAGIAALTTLRG